MRIRFDPTDPDKIEFTAEITMSLGAWKEIRSQLKTILHPTMELKRAIDDVVWQAEKTFSPRLEQNETGS